MALRALRKDLLLRYACSVKMLQVCSRTQPATALNTATEFWPSRSKISREEAFLIPNLQVSFLHTSSCLHKSKAKKSQKKMEVFVDPRDVSDFIDLEEILQDMQKVVEELKQDYVQNFRVGADSKLFDQLKVPIEGDLYQLREVAKVTKKSEKAFELDFVSFPEALPAAQAAIQLSSLNLNPTVKGTKLEVAIPAVTSEHRKTLAKSAKQRLNEAKDQIRKVRNRHEKHLAKVEHVPEDTEKAIKKQIGVYVDSTCSESEAIFKVKEKDLLLQ